MKAALIVPNRMKGRRPEKLNRDRRLSTPMIKEATSIAGQRLSSRSALSEGSVSTSKYNAGHAKGTATSSADSSAQGAVRPHHNKNAPSAKQISEIGRL